MPSSHPTPSFADIFLDPSSGAGLSTQIYEQLRDRINAGELRPGDLLVPSRLLARQLGVSRHTVTTAYSRLADEGYTEGHAGGGSAIAPGVAPTNFAPRRSGVVRARERMQDLRADYFPQSGPDCRYDLRAGVPDESLFPREAWRRSLVAASRDRVFHGDPRGEARLRRTISQWIARSRSVVADPDTIMITSGAQQAIDLLSRLLLEPGDTVAVEVPGYMPVVALLRSYGANVVGVPVDAEGLQVSALPARARLVYTTPSHQFPLGVTMSQTRRRALLTWAQRHGAAIIEDDYDSEFRHADRPLEPIYRLDPDGRVVYIASYSKTLSPGLRLGFAVVPESIAGSLAALRQTLDWHPPTVTQLALHDMIESGRFERHLRKVRQVYTERHRIVETALAGEAPPMLTPVKSAGGLHVTAIADWSPLTDEERVTRMARDAGVAVTGLRQHYHAGDPREGLVIGFGAIATEHLPEAMSTLMASIIRAAATAE